MANLVCSLCGSQLPRLEDRSSPVPELLGTNSAPTSIQTEAIKKYLIGIGNEIQLLETRVQQMRAAIDELQSQQESLKAIGKEHRALLSSAQRVYPELLSEIFTIFVHSNLVENPGTHFWNIKDNFDPIRGPLLLTSICRSWRRAAIATPELWTIIRFVVRPRRRFNLMDMWLERSRDQKLTIAIVDANDYVLDFVAVATGACNQQVLRLVSSQAHRWQSASFRLPYVKECWDAFAAAKGHIQRLERLELVLSREAWQDYIPDMFSDGSLLTDLTLANCPFPFSRFPVRREGITRLWFGSRNTLGSLIPIAIDTFFKGLMCLPNLAHLEIQNPTGFAPARSPSTRVISLPNLVTFELIQHFQPYGIAELWQALQLPNLVSLRVRFRSQRPWCHSPFLNFFIRCSELQHLTLISPSIQQEQLIEVFQLFPADGITKLNIGLPNHPESWRVFDHLASQNTLPRLSTLAITLFSGFSVTIGFIQKLVEMARTRMTKVAQGHAQLQSVSLGFEGLDGSLITQALSLLRTTLQLSDRIRLNHKSESIILERA